VRADPVVLLPAAGATLICAVSWVGWVTTQALELLVLAIGIQLAAGVAISWLACRERRALARAVAVTIPIFGILAIAWIDGIRGEGGAELLADLQARPVRRDGAEVSRRLTASLSPCEAIVSGNVDCRRATITHLARRAAADDITILKWARAQPDPELAVDAALALEDIDQRMDALVLVARDAANVSPSFATHAAVVRVICAGIVSGLVDAALITKLAVEARTHHEAAITIEPASAGLIAAARARIELAARRPAVALAVLEDVFGKCADAEIVELYTEAAYACRRFDLVSGMECDSPASAGSSHFGTHGHGDVGG
jgi:hypothetical protein